MHCAIVNTLRCDPTLLQRAGGLKVLLETAARHAAGPDVSLCRQSLGLAVELAPTSDCAAGDLAGVPASICSLLAHLS